MLKVKATKFLPWQPCVLAKALRHSVLPNNPALGVTPLQNPH